MAKAKLATIQLNSSDDIDANLKHAEHWIQYATKHGAQLVALPENFAYMGRESEKIQNLVEIQNKAVNFLQKSSSNNGIYVLGGGYPTQSPDPKKAYNTSSIYSPNGDKIYQYNKIHLFDTNPGDGIQYKESQSVYPGSDIPKVIDILEFGRIASVICYDLRFPELFRKISEQKVNVIFVPSAFTELTGKAHWEVLLRARAIENFVYIVAPGQTGTHTLKDKEPTESTVDSISISAPPSLTSLPLSSSYTSSESKPSHYKNQTNYKKTYGHSLIISPWGEVLSDAGEEVGCCIVEIDTSDVENYRQKIPSLLHRRLF